MSGEALYERYKDALKRGHVASLRGRLEEALTAYAEAAAIAPERGTPHTSAGTALMRRKRPADALRHYAVALVLAPRDEAALLGRAQALAALDRRADAATAFDALAETRAANGKLADAVDAARRGLELAEGRERRRTLGQLIERLRESTPGEPGRAAMERALRVLDGPAVPMAAASAGVSDGPVTAVPAADAVAQAGAELDSDADAHADVADADADSHDHADGDAKAEADAAADPTDDAGTGTAPDAGSEVDQASEDDPEPEVPAPVEPALRAALDRDLAPDLDPEDLARLVDRAVDAGDAVDGLERLLDLAAAYRRRGSLDAALGACYQAVSLDPDNLDLHLGLAELYDERGWGLLATEKLDLVERLATLDDDPLAARRVAAARSARG